MNINWKKPLFYLLLPILVVMAFVGFPIPVAPLQRIKPSQEHAAPAEERSQR